MVSNKTFILGVGAQKAGTSWLHQYIQNSPNANLGQLKEYQFWSMAVEKRNSKRIELLKKPHLDFDNDDLLRWLMLTRRSFYEIYFNSIINSGYEITGDISPQYAFLSSTDFEYIKKRMETYGFHVKVIYLIRDPVERIWSNIRMEKNLYSSIDKKISDSNAVKLSYKKDRWKFDSLYESRIPRLRSAFNKEDLYIGIYEELFTEDSMKSLSEFIGVTYDPKFLRKKINASEKKEEIDLDVVNEVREYYKETYKFCFQNFPQTKNLWNMHS